MQQMKYEKSCGAVVFARIDGKIKYLLVANLEGVWGFPKGHMENGETEIETALREVYEETNLKIKLIGDFKTTDEHLIPSKKDTVKQIVYFLGEFDDYEKIVFQKEELSGVKLVDYEEAIDMFQYESSKRILMKANEFLNKYK